MVSLALMSVVLFPPTQKVLPGQQCPIPWLVQRVTVALSLQVSYVSQVVSPLENVSFGLPSQPFRFAQVAIISLTLGDLNGFSPVV